MRRRISATVLAALAAAAPLAAQAHPGDHDHMGMTELAEHVMSQPYHLAGLIGLLVAGAVAFAWLIRGRLR